MRIIELGDKVRPKVKFNTIKYNDKEIYIHFIVTNPLIVGITKLVRGDAKIIDGKYIYSISGGGENQYIIFVCTPKSYIKLNDMTIKPDTTIKSINFKIIDLGHPNLGIGSWLTIGKIGNSLEIWPILISDPYLYLFRYWSWEKRKIIIDFGEKYRESIIINLKKLHGLYISNSYLVYTYNDEPYIGYGGFKINILALLK